MFRCGWHTVVCARMVENHVVFRTNESNVGDHIINIHMTITSIHYPIYSDLSVR